MIMTICPNCKYELITDSYTNCPMCGAPLYSNSIGVAWCG